MKVHRDGELKVKIKKILNIFYEAYLAFRNILHIQILIILFFFSFNF